ncbi:MAG: hypothetical protein M1827_001654 [Pycnora praestabilis]|nr:MAG: hypothetical protein M1827_001654 [Pycnora praestabilis]
MAGLKFAELSGDVKSSIISFIKRPTDLKSLCLVSAEIRDIAIRQLYRKVEIDIGGSGDSQLSAFLGRDNPGLSHIRILEINLDRGPASVSPSRSPSPQRGIRGHPPDRRGSFDRVRVVERPNRDAYRQAQFTMRLLLDFLPAHILEDFRWNTWEPLSHETFILLCKKQQRLKRLEMNPLDTALMPILEKRPEILSRLDQVKSLQLCFVNRDSLSICQKVVELNPDIEKLEIILGFDDDDHEALDTLHDSSAGPGLITSTVFSHMLPFDKCKPLKPKEVRLQDLDLRYAADTYLKVIDFRGVENLVVRGCSGADALFAELIKPDHRPATLRKLRVVHREDEQHYAMEAIENFLRMTSGLKGLCIDMTHAKALPKINCITRHSSTLLALIVQVSDRQGDMNYDLEDMEKLCTDCSKLRQLSLAFPPTSVVEDAVSPEFGSFLTSSIKLPHLVTLNIIRWPTFRPTQDHPHHSPRGHNPVQLPKGVYKALVQRMAQFFFKRSLALAEENHTQSKLIAIAFGSDGVNKWMPGRIDYDMSPGRGRHGWNLQQMVFARGQQIDPFGRTSLLAVKIKLPLLKFAEPDSEILDYRVQEDARHNQIIILPPPPPPAFHGQYP